MDNIAKFQQMLAEERVRLARTESDPTIRAAKAEMLNRLDERLERLFNEQMQEAAGEWEADQAHKSIAEIVEPMRRGLARLAEGAGVFGGLQHLYTADELESMELKNAFK